MQVGQTVFHKVHEFVGVITDIEIDMLGGSNNVIEITHGNHPYTENKETYEAVSHSLEVIGFIESTESSSEDAFENLLDELLKVEVEVNTDDSTEEEIEVDVNGSIDITLVDGTELNFEFYSDFVDFMERTKLL